MELAGLRILVALEDAGSLTRAADDLGMARSTVARRLAALEADLGVPLSAKTALGTVVTPAGQAVAEHARDVLRRADDLRAVAREGALPRGPLHLVLPVGVPPALTVLVMALLRARHPNLRVVVRSSADPVAELRDGGDLAVHFGRDPPRGPFRSRVVVRLHERLLASPVYLAAHGRPQSPADLAQHTLLSWLPPDERSDVWPSARGPVRVDPVFVAVDFGHVRALVVAGQGIGRVPHSDMPITPRAPELEVVLPEAFGRPLALRVLIPEATASLPRTRVQLAVWDTLTQSLAPDPE